ncbi:MAG TPA: hypothetical protein VFL99_03590 [Segeticoccus sp.]|uniref:hypothetical protein n=1 Tax=Segeticoccus sp. TaxID=2706531 RepID=UPI002D80D5D5|nr:hypothetical protein [Segeticoccus sp.]HET8599384.1 hypothetical protein [Segeticoccus sp.]
MILILGLKTYLTVVDTFVTTCETCGARAAHEVARQVRKLTFFFLPLFPVSTSYVDTCLACGRRKKVPKEQAVSH